MRQSTRNWRPMGEWMALEGGDERDKMGREDRPETMKGFRRAEKDVWRGEKEQSHVGRQLSF